MKAFVDSRKLISTALGYTSLRNYLVPYMCPRL
ncbi:MAG: hypothetical protein ACI9Y1_003325, partial [Lentisphaeria bacterium]